MLTHFYLGFVFFYSLEEVTLYCLIGLNKMSVTDKNCFNPIFQLCRKLPVGIPTSKSTLVEMFMVKLFLFWTISVMNFCKSPFLTPNN